MKLASRGNLSFRMAAATRMDYDEWSKEKILEYPERITVAAENITESLKKLQKDELSKQVTNELNRLGGY